MEGMAGVGGTASLAGGSFVAEAIGVLAGRGLSGSNAGAATGTVSLGQEDLAVDFIVVGWRLGLADARCQQLHLGPRLLGDAISEFAGSSSSGKKLRVKTEFGLLSLSDSRSSAISPTPAE